MNAARVAAALGLRAAGWKSGDTPRVTKLVAPFRGGKESAPWRNHNAGGEPESNA